MRIALLLCLLLATGGAFAQTGAIAHKSHGGTDAEWGAALEEAGADFGRAPTEEVKDARLDSVIFVSDSVAVMVTSTWCRRMYVPESQAQRWRAGRDTVRRHALFSKRHALDSIKAILRTQYYFRNHVDSVRFVGYDNDNSCAPYQSSGLEAAGFAGDSDDPPPPTAGLLAALALLGAGVAGGIAWLMRRLPRLS
ncbi:MAG: hypothetical protein EOO11_02480 [Chitinophagaceae bacterium]|nr:MAG: hypothetical protein EOO11_02480 [Chitinophagaceae bacterium]